MTILGVELYKLDVLVDKAHKCKECDFHNYCALSVPVNRLVSLQNLNLYQEDKYKMKKSFSNSSVLYQLKSITGIFSNPCTNINPITELNDYCYGIQKLKHY